jgi:chromate transporter
VTAAAVGAIAGAAVILGRRGIVDWQTGAIAMITFIGSLATKKIPEPLLIIAAGFLGLLLHKGTH